MKLVARIVQCLTAAHQVRLGQQARAARKAPAESAAFRVLMQQLGRLGRLVLRAQQVLHLRSLALQVQQVLLAQPV